LTATFFVRSGGINDYSLCRFVALLNLRGPCKLQLDRPHFDGDLAKIPVITHTFAKFGPWKAGGYLWDVVKDPPHTFDWLRNLKVAFD
jgi:hypothetical protein